MPLRVFCELRSELNDLGIEQTILHFKGNKVDILNDITNKTKVDGTYKKKKSAILTWRDPFKLEGCFLGGLLDDGEKRFIVSSKWQNFKLWVYDKCFGVQCWSEQTWPHVIDQVVHVYFDNAAGSLS